MLSTDVALVIGLLELGAVVYAFLLVLLIRKRPARTVDWGLLLATAGTLAWYAARAIGTFYTEFGGPAPEAKPPQFLQDFGLALALAALLQVAAGLNERRFTPLWYGLAPIAWWTVHSGHDRAHFVLVGLSIGVTIVELLIRRPADYLEQRFRRAFAIALGLALAGAAFGEESNGAALAGLAPAICVLYFAARFQFFGLVITRRLGFATVLGLASAVYLLVVRRFADVIESESETLAPAIELLLILAAVVAWIPLYAWMSRAISKRTRLFGDFGERLTQKAASIFPFELRLEYIAGELGRLFKLRRVLIATADESEPRIVMFGPPADVSIAPLADRVREERLDAVIGPGSARSKSISALLQRTPFNHLFPLWYEDRLVGLLLVDPSPRRYLDESVDMLRGLSRQISHAIESSRLVERKISLETALARSEHMASLGQMAASIVHEVKNPLSSIKAIAQVMQEDIQVNGDHRRDLSFIVGEINRLNSRVEGLLTFSRPIAEKRMDVKLAEVLEDISRTLNREHGERRIRIEHSAPGLTLRNTSPHRLHEIVLNLAINAVQASPPDGTVELRAGLSPEGGGKVILRVIDQGAGIPREIQNRVFDLFFTTKSNGSGLGLATVYWHLRYLGGEVRFESPVNAAGGTVFTVTLPVEAA
jgi:signal transduction histidine kinase